MGLNISNIEYGDITANRHLGNARSVEANQRVDKARQQKMILDTLKNGNFTCEEIANACRIAPHKISGRFKALREGGVIEFSGEVRNRANVYRLKKA